MNSFLGLSLQKVRHGKGKAEHSAPGCSRRRFLGDSAEVYLPTAYRGKNLGVAEHYPFALDASSGNLSFRVNSAHIGRLLVPVDWVLAKAEAACQTGFPQRKHGLLCRALVAEGFDAQHFGFGQPR